MNLTCSQETSLKDKLQLHNITSCNPPEMILPFSKKEYTETKFRKV